MKNNKKIYTIFAIILTLSVLISCIQISPITVFAERESTEKIYCDATLEDNFTENEVIIVVFPEYNMKNYTIDDFSEIDCIGIRELSTDVDEGSLERIIKLTIPGDDKSNVLAAIKKLELRDDIYLAEPNYLYSIDTSPNDTYCANGEQWAIETLELPTAWSLNTGSSSVTVGVIDTGIDATHPDLVNRVSTTLSRDYSGAGASGLTDTAGHGTHVAGIIGAQGNNSVGVTGVCWNVTLVSLKVSVTGYGIEADYIIDAVEYAETAGIDILNCSINAYRGDNGFNGALKTAIRDYSGLFVCSAGNRGDDNDTIENYPSNHNDLSNVISVGASTENDTRWANSNYGANTVDLFAPGDDILSCIPTQFCTSGICNSATHVADGYHAISGTSMAAPHVAGTAALLLSRYPDLSASNMKQIILNSVDTSLSFEGLCKTGGRLNSYEAIVYRNFHNHTYTYENCGDNHKCICTVCNYVKYEAHNWVYSPIYPSSVTPQYIPQYVCEKCGAISLNASALTLSTEEHLHIARE